MKSLVECSSATNGVELKSILGVIEDLSTILVSMCILLNHGLSLRVDRFLQNYIHKSTKILELDIYWIFIKIIDFYRNTLSSNLQESFFSEKMSLVQRNFVFFIFIGLILDLKKKHLRWQQDHYILLLNIQ